MRYLSHTLHLNYSRGTMKITLSCAILLSLMIISLLPTTTYSSSSAQNDALNKNADNVESCKCCCDKVNDNGHDVTQSCCKKLQFIDAWARPAIINGNSAIYLTIKNESDENIEIIGIEAEDIAHKIELHQSIENNGTMTMSKIDHLLIPAKTNFTLKRGGFHIMLMKLKKPLTKGDLFNLTFILKDHVKKTISVIIKSS